jgi:hypothetical protein
MLCLTALRVELRSSLHGRQVKHSKLIVTALMTRDALVIAPSTACWMSFLSLRVLFHHRPGLMIIISESSRAGAGRKIRTLSGSTVFGIDWNALVESREVMVPPTNLDHYSKATSNISIVNRITTMRNSGPLHTFFDDASLIASPTLHPKRWSIPASCTAKRESALSKAKVVAKKFAKKLNCFSSDEEDDDGKGRKGSTSTVSTIVSSIAEITDAVSQMKWRSYFRKIDERRRIRKSSRVNFGGSKPTAEAFSQSTPIPD